MLSSILEEFSWEMASEEEKLHGMYLHANNNQSECSFGELSEQLHGYGHIGLKKEG